MDPGPVLHYMPSEPVRTEYRGGLCAWQDRSMLEEGHFYPLKSMKAEERLWWYSRFFDCVEVNSTFYAPLFAQNVGPLGQAHAGGLPLQREGLCPADRGQFENRVFPREARAWAFQTFQETLQPLKDAGKLEERRHNANGASSG